MNTDTYIICQDYNTAAIKTLAKKPVSPMKKMKRKVDYEQDTEDTGLEAENAMKKLCLAEQRGTGRDVNMLSQQLLSFQSRFIQYFFYNDAAVFLNI